MRARRSVLLLAAAAALLGAGGSLPARAQDAGAAVTGDTLFGSYELEARGTGVQASYELVGLLPGGAKVLDLTIPESLARFSSGPVGYGLASLAYPGGLIVNLDALISQTGGDGSAIPPYPIKAEAFFPAGPTEAQQVQAGSVQQVRTGELGVEVLATFPAVEANPAVTVGTISSGSRSSIEDGKAVSRTRVALGDITILGGVITIDSLVTDLVAVHDGVTGTADGGTTATGVKFLGLAASLTTEGGLVLDKAPPVTGPGGPLGSILDPILAPLNDLTAPVRALVDQVLRQAVPSLTEPLKAAGIDIRLLTSADVASASGAAGRTSSGLSITLSYEGKEQAALVDLLNSIPDELKPSLGPIPFPVSFLAENHIIGLTLGTGTVSALASAPFDVDAGEIPDLSGGDLGSFDAGTLSPEFGTDLPDLPPPVTPGESPDGDAASSIASAAIPALLLAVILLASPLFGVASTRLADNVLATTSSSCPTGLDQPPPAPRQS